MPCLQNVNLAEYCIGVLNYCVLFQAMGSSCFKDDAQGSDNDTKVSDSVFRFDIQIKLFTN